MEDSHQFSSLEELGTTGFTSTLEGAIRDLDISVNREGEVHDSQNFLCFPLKTFGDQRQFTTFVYDTSDRKMKKCVCTLTLIDDIDEKSFLGKKTKRGKRGGESGVGPAGAGGSDSSEATTTTCASASATSSDTK